jgi:tetratricopeptide (TPR) repeat protein
MDTTQQLQTAYETAKAGDRPSARQLVKEVIKAEPNNDAAWYLYAKIAETRQASIQCLEKVLEINPSHARARQDLVRFKGQDFTPPTPQVHNLNSQARQRTTNEQRSKGLPVWLWIVVAGFVGIASIACLGYFVLAGALLPGAQPSSPITTGRPLILSTPTSDCTCARATKYLDSTFARFDSISAQILSIANAYDEADWYRLNFTVFSSEAKIIYKEQLAELPPNCLQAFQSKTVSLLWNWQQTMEYAASGQYDAADLFIQGFMDDFSALENEGERLLQEELNGCIMDPNSGPSL